MGDTLGHRGDVTISENGQEMTVPIGEWTAFWEELAQPKFQSHFDNESGPEARTLYRKLVSRLPTPAA